MPNQAPSIVPSDGDPLVEIIAHLGAVLIQAGASDDQIIVDHVRSAHRLPLDLRQSSARGPEVSHEA
jgi:hypothetical protein